jgi:hypothetical protein
MDVLFNFPDLVAFKVQMGFVPRQGEIVKLYRLTYNDFPTLNDFHKFADGDYKRHTWVVNRVVWTPAGDGKSYVNIILQKAPTYLLEAEN